MELSDDSGWVDQFRDTFDYELAQRDSATDKNKNKPRQGGKESSKRKFAYLTAFQAVESAAVDGRGRIIGHFEEVSCLSFAMCKMMCLLPCCLLCDMESAMFLMKIQGVCMCVCLCVCVCVWLLVDVARTSLFY